MGWNLKIFSPLPLPGIVVCPLGTNQTSLVCFKTAHVNSLYKTYVNFNLFMKFKSLFIHSQSLLLMNINCPASKLCLLLRAPICASELSCPPVWAHRAGLVPLYLLHLEHHYNVLQNLHICFLVSKDTQLLEAIGWLGMSLFSANGCWVES